MLITSVVSMLSNPNNEVVKGICKYEHKSASRQDEEENDQIIFEHWSVGRYLHI